MIGRKLREAGLFKPKVKGLINTENTEHEPVDLKTRRRTITEDQKHKAESIKGI